MRVIQLECGSSSGRPSSAAVGRAGLGVSLSNSARSAADRRARSSTLTLPISLMSWARAWVAGSSKKLASTIAASLCAALYGIATKLVLPMLPLRIVKLRTEAGNWPLSTDTAASAGLNDSVMSISPSLSNWRCAWPFSGNCWPRRHRAGRNWSYQAHSGAVTRAKLSSLAGCCITVGSGVRS